MIPKTSQFGQPTPVAETKERQHFSSMTMEILSFSIPISTNFGKAEPPEEKSEMIYHNQIWVILFIYQPETIRFPYY